jgi:phosphopantothenoylcysteine synthetase/decarboxylase
MLLMYFPDPILFFPNMNPVMWNKKTTQRNVASLLEEGHRVVSPSGNGWESPTGRPLDSGHMPPPSATAD